MRTKSLLALLGTLILIALLAFFVLSDNVIKIGFGTGNTGTPIVEEKSNENIEETTTEQTTQPTTDETPVDVKPTSMEVANEAVINSQISEVNVDSVAIPDVSEQGVESVSAEIPVEQATTNNEISVTTEQQPEVTSAEEINVEQTTSENKPIEVKSFSFSNPLSYQNINLGLDLKGGVSIVYEADEPNPSSEDMDSAIRLLRTRLDNKGYTEAEVSKQGNRRIRVEIPGIGDPNKAVEEIGRTAELRFYGLTEEQLNSIQTEAEKMADGFGEEADVLQKYQIYLFMFSQGIQQNGELVMQGLDVARANRSYQQSNVGPIEPVIALELTSEGTTKFANATKKYKNNFIVIMLDNDILSIPRVNDEITTGKAVITGMQDDDEAATTAELINSGALPFKLNAIQRSVIEARLGKDSFDTSKIAGIIGTALVILYMIALYRFPGFVSGISLVAYLFLMLATLSVFNVTLTLPGIAGIILSVGMAVDANVIIFTRIKEELNMEKTLRAAIKSGFHKAMSAILDGNITTFIIAVVLFWQGTGPIKGFAQTLMIGVALSMFTAIVVTRVLMSNFVELGVNSPVIYGAKKVYKRVGDLSKK